MTDTTHNGWTNYATWRVNLEMVDGMTAADFGFYDADADVYELANAVRESCEDTVCNGSNELAHGYALAFLSDVNWSEIARHLIDAHADA